MANGERVPVQTYVTEAQRDIWEREAKQRDMSRAEYVRTMVQAGRRSFELSETGTDTNADSGNAGDAQVSDATPGVDGLEDRILDVLENEGVADWETLVAGVTDNIESRLDTTLERLQADNRVRYSGRRGGYTVVDDE